MKERKVDEKKVLFESKKKCKFLSHVDILERPVAEGHDCKKHEDSANANDEDDHHDHCVAVALFYYSHKIKRQACSVQKYQDLKKRNNQRKSQIGKGREKWRRCVKSKRIREKP